MTPIHEMKTRKATWAEADGGDTSIGVTCRGVFFEVDGREVGVVIRDQPEGVATPLLEAIAALPEMVTALRHIAACDAQDECGFCKRKAKAALARIGGPP